MADRNRRKPPNPQGVPKQHGRKPPNPTRAKTQHGRRPPAPPPHSSSGSCCPMVAAVKAVGRGRYRLARRYAVMSVRLISGRVAVVLLKPKPVGWPFPRPWRPKPKAAW